MTAQVQVKVDISPIYQAVENALNAAAQEWMQIALKKVPVRKARSTKNIGSRSPAFPVRLAGGRGLTNAQAKLRREFVVMSGRQRAQFVGLMSGHGPRNQAAQLFRYTQGPLKGKAPEILVARGRGLAGAEVTHGGTLKESIGIELAKRENDRITVVMKATAPYAKFMDEGFHHKGGGKVPGRHFAREPLHNIVIPNLRDGKYFKG